MAESETYDAPPSGRETRTARRGLGRGLSELLGGVGPAAGGAPRAGLAEIPLDAIRPNPDQPRRAIDAAGLEALAESIRTSGLVQPVVVRPLSDAPGAFELVAGERRWRAAGMAGLTALPALIRDADEAERLELGLVENLVRQDLSPIEVATACATLIEDFGITQTALARRLGRSRPAVANLVRLLELPEDVQHLVSGGELTEGHARAILMADGSAARRRLARRAVEEGLSVRAVEAHARGVRASGGRAAPPSEAPRAADRAIDGFFGAFGATVRVRCTPGGAVRVELVFPDETAFEAALERLAPPQT